MQYFTKHYHAPGTAPGTLVAADSEPADLSIRLVDYSAEHMEEHELSEPSDCTPFLSRDSRTWVQVQGPADPDTLRRLGELFDLHDLALEDVLNTGQRPKVDVYDDQLFMTLVLPLYEDGELEMVQVSLFMGKNYLIGFCPMKEDIFEPVRKRMRTPGNKRFLGREIDYLLYALVDLVVDGGFPVLETFGDQLALLEEALLERPSRQTLAHLYALKRELMTLRRALWPQREMVGGLLHMEESLVRPETFVYLRDCHDHTIQIIDLLESFRDMAGGMLDIYLSGTANRTNEIMRTLTLIATIFIPLTFVVGVYGMNFEHPDSPWAMPELHWYYGYPMIWGVMIAMTLGLLWFFRRKHWI